MDKGEIIIGTRSEYKVDPSLYKYVSGIHCKVIRKADGIYIEDLNSRNGTYVNDVRVVTKRINSNDRVSLGGQGDNHYNLDLGAVLKMIPISDVEFKERFSRLQTVYEEYTKRIEKSEQKIQESSRILTMLPMTLPGIIIGVLPLVLIGEESPNAGGVRIAITIIGGILTVTGLLFGAKMSSKSMAKNKKEIKQLQEEFREEYVCPGCVRELGIQTSWDFWKRKGACPYCNRQW